MTTNADLIAQWRSAHPTERLSVPVLLDTLGLTTLSWANLWGADLSWADLRGADLWGADLWGADLYGADLRGANLRGANLGGAIHEHIMPINADASGMGALYPQAEGWRVSIGCWRHHTLGDFADLLADRIDWPEAEGEERERRRPLLRAIHATCLAFVDQMPSDLIDRHAAARAEVAS